MFAKNPFYVSKAVAPVKPSMRVSEAAPSSTSSPISVTVAIYPATGT